MEALSWESSDSSRVRRLFVGNTGSSSRMSRKGSRSGRMASGLDDEDRPGSALATVRGGFRRLPRPSVLVTSLKGSGGTSALCGGDSPGIALAAVGYGVFRISSNVSSSMGGGYWAESSSCDVPSTSLCLGGRMPSTRFVLAGVAVMRRMLSLADAVGVL